MRILLFTTAYRPLIGGSELAVEAIARHLPDVSFDIITPRFSSKLSKYEAEGNVTIRRVGFGSKIDKFFFPLLGTISGLILVIRTFGLLASVFPRTPWWALVLPRSRSVARSTLGQKKYHAIHAYQASHSAGAAVFVSMFTGIPMILTLQEGKNLKTQSAWVQEFRKFIIHAADHFTAISNYLVDYILTIRPNADAALIPNGVEYEKFASPNLKLSVEQKNRLGMDKNQFVIMTASRLVPKNGVADLIQAFAILRSKIPAVLIVIGEGPLQQKLENLAMDVGIKEHIYFVGKVEHHELPKYLVCADVFVRVSLSEGMGSAFLEAMAAGVPVVASAVGGITDFLRDRETGMLAHPSDPSDIARAIEDLFKDENLRHRLIENGQKLVYEKYQWSQIAQQMKNLYSSLLIRH